MVGLARARVKIGLGNLVYKHEVTIWLTCRHRRPKKAIDGSQATDLASAEPNEPTRPPVTTGFLEVSTC